MDKKNVLISDANHGGLVLLEEYYKYTNNNLFFYDIYNKLSDSKKSELSRKFNVKFLTLDEIRQNEDSFVKINPVHMPPVINTDFTHHEFVGYLLDKRGYDFKMIQVSGVKGKTTVTSLIRDVLRRYNILVLTSDKLTFNDKILMEKLSITPASIITAVNEADCNGLLDSVDYAVFEVSLGVVPNAYLNVLTNILEDYPIAKGSSSASVAKESVFSAENVICDYDSYMKYYTDQNHVVLLSFDNSSADIFAYDVHYDIENTVFKMNYFNKTYVIHHFALSDFYINNLLFAISVGLMLDIDIEEIISSLSNSYGIDGRNSYKIIRDKMVIEDINPGLNTTSIKKCVENLGKYSQDYQIIIGGDYGITCEEIDEEQLGNYLKNISPEKLVFTGELGKNLEKSLKNNYLYFNRLQQAMDFCIDNNENRIIQVIYRSEYNRNKDNLFKN